MTLRTAFLWLMLALGGSVHAAAFLEPTGGLAAPVAVQPSLAGLHIGSGATANKFLNSAGQIVQLRGVDQDGLEYMCNGGSAVFDPTGPGTPANITQLQTWAVNVVRLPVNEQCWLGINGEPANYTAAFYKSTIQTYVSQLTAANIAVIIDLQWVGAGTTQATGSTNQVPMPDADHAPAFWTSVATAFASNPMVIFDLFNEPYPDNNGNTTAAWTCLLNGGMGSTSGTCPGVSQNGVFYNAAGMQSLVTAIRATGATNIIDSPGVQFSNTINQWLTYKPTDTLSPPQIAAAWHSYNDQICNNQTCWTNQILPVINTVPVNTEEIGEHDCQGVYILPLMTWEDSVGGNYMGWSWNTYNCSSFPALISATNPVVPTGFGYAMMTHLLSAAGLTPPPPPTIPFFSSTYPFGIAVGYTGTNNYSATDGTTYYPDVPNAALTVQVTNPLSMTAFTSTDTFTGTPDPHLYLTGRQGCCGIWTINVPNGNYYVTLGMAQNSVYNTIPAGTLGPWGQDETIQGNQVASCQFSSYSGGNVPPGQTTTCPMAAVLAPVIDQVQTVTYTVSVFNQQLMIEVAASFGGGRATILNTIKIAQAP